MSGPVWHCECGHDPCDGLDCGVYLPGHAPRKPLPARTAAEHAVTRAKAWATRRAKYGTSGHGRSYAR